MSDWLHAFYLAAVQGITEFLPISSSGHLALIPWLFGWSDQGLAFDVAVHVGTLIAVVTYFYQDLRHLVGDWIRSLFGGPATLHSKLAWCILFATLMVGLAGVTFESLVSGSLRDPIPIAIATIVFGLILGLTDKYGSKSRALDQISWRDVLIIGIAQTIALIPGTSRSGITISAGLMMGLTRDAAQPGFHF